MTRDEFAALYRGVCTAVVGAAGLIPAPGSLLRSMAAAPLKAAVTAAGGKDALAAVEGMIDDYVKGGTMPAACLACRVGLHVVIHQALAIARGAVKTEIAVAEGGEVAAEAVLDVGVAASGALDGGVSEALEPPLISLEAALDALTAATGLTAVEIVDLVATWLEAGIDRTRLIEWICTRLSACPERPPRVLQINCVMFGDGPLADLARFNLYSWKALGHDVTVYAARWDTRPRSASSLGLDGGIRVVDLYRLVGETDRTLPTFRKARALLLAWLDAAKAKPPTVAGDQVYNVVDLAKSYIAATRVGIVLDLKVGPSRWVHDYLGALGTKFVSYTRGGNTAGELPENQCLGTMQVGNAIRAAYQERFEGRISAPEVLEGYRAAPTGAWFNVITGWHGNACTRIGYLDSATRAPDGTEDLAHKYDVSEIHGQGHGPFRVFKMAGDQSNKSAQSTKPEDIASLASHVWSAELKGAAGADPSFLARVETALTGLQKPAR